MHTLLDALADALDRAFATTPGEQVPPAAVLWPDELGAWSGLVPRLRERLPGLLALGGYAPAERRGPAIWLRCAVDGTLAAPVVPPGVTPIVYLPGIGRSTLRTVGALPADLIPLADLPFRGTIFGPEGGRDWTPLSFLANARQGLGLNVARDTATAEALRRALPAFAREDAGALRDRPLDAAYFDGLLVGDPARDLLAWLDAPDLFRQSCDDARWATFCAVTKGRYGFDPERDGALAAARGLGEASGAWSGVWDRFAEAPARYKAVADRLSDAAPAGLGGLFAAHSGRWPQANEAAEDALRTALLKVGALPAEEAAARIVALNREHAPRRGTVWANLDRAPLARALEALVRLVEAVDRPLPGDTAEALATAYASGGHAADGALLDALAAARRDADLDAVAAAARAVYQPWLESHARRLQDLAREAPPRANAPAMPPDGTAVLFVDGLRADVAAALATSLEGRGYDVPRTHGWAALPTVTPTAKPAASPIAARLGPGALSPDGFHTALPDGRTLKADRFRAALAEAGVAYLTPAQTGTGNGVAWTETGEIDADGHHHGLRLAHRIPELIERVTERVAALLSAGWARVRIVTDHGWLLVPGGLTKATIPLALTDDRWGRCAMLKSAADASGTSALVVPWYWNAEVRVALAPGACAFTEGYVYAHGGLTLQEAVTVTLTVSRSGGSGGRPELDRLRWSGLRLRVYLATTGTAHAAELRTHAADAGTRLAGPALFDDTGAASLLVADDGLEGAAALLVVLGPGGDVLLQHAVVVGQN